MPLINAQNFLGLVRSYRVCWFGGRYGGGKTALAVRTAYELLNGGHADYLLSNLSCVWADSPEDVVVRDPHYLDTVLLMDEAGLFLKSAQDADSMLAFMRKYNTYLLLPSVRRPARTVTDLQVWRTMNLEVIGIPCWVYQYFLKNAGIKQEERFYWWRPSEIFGVYDTEDTPLDESDIGDFLEEHLSRYAGKKRKQTNEVSGVETVGGEIEYLLEEAREIAESISVSRKSRRRRNR